MNVGRLRVGPLVVLWYATSIAAVATCKGVLGEAPCPAMLCAAQFSVAVIGTRILAPMQALGSLQGKAEASLVRCISLCYTLGFILTNAAISIAAPSFVETFKAAEPISTVAMAAVVLGERESGLALAALLPLVIGVAMASSSSATFSTTGMLLALASNVSFSARAVLTKSLKRDHASALVAGSDVALFYHVSRFGLCLLIPVALCMDSGALLEACSGRSGSSIARLILMLLLNGLSHSTYNGVSFLVLAKVSITTHAVLNIIRRVLVIAAAALIFATPVSAFNWVGVALAVLGIGAFARSKGASERAGAAMITDPSGKRMRPARSSAKHAGSLLPV